MRDTCDSHIVSHVYHTKFSILPVFPYPIAKPPLFKVVFVKIWTVAQNLLN